MLAYIVAAAMANAPDPGSPTVASWADIVFSDETGGSESTVSTVTFAGGGSREMLVTHDISIGSLKVQLDGGSFVSVSSGYTFNVTTGQTVTFQYRCFFASESATVAVYDNTLLAAVDSFTCDFTFLG